MYKGPTLVLVWNSLVFLPLPQTLLCPALPHNDTADVGGLVKGFLGDTSRTQDRQKVQYNAGTIAETQQTAAAASTEKVESLADLMSGRPYLGYQLCSLLPRQP